jgi:hypothetical protein
MIDVTPAEAEVLRPYGPHTGYLLEDVGRADDRDLPGTGLKRVALLLFILFFGTSGGRASTSGS